MNTYQFSAAVVAIGDLDGDSDADVVFATPYRIGWYENIDGKGTFGVERLVAECQSFDCALGGGIAVADVDGDGDQDIIGKSSALIGQPDTYFWLANLGSAEQFAAMVPVSKTVYEQFKTDDFTADFDSDGDLDEWQIDFHAASIFWIENVDGTLSPERTHSISAAKSVDYFAFCGCLTVDVADIDGDGDLDISTGSYNAYFRSGTSHWHENLSDQGRFSRQQPGVLQVPGANDLLSADIDGDGDVDFVTDTNGRVVLHLNDNGAFTPINILSSPERFYSTNGTQLIDLDSDGRLDLLVANRSGITWRRNIGGPAYFDDGHVIDDSIDDTMSFARLYDAADVDGDGDSDVVVAVSNVLFWYENDSVSRSFRQHQWIDVGDRNLFTLVDVDGDNDLDLLTSGVGDFVWYENQGGLLGKAATAVKRVEETMTYSQYAADIDGDGDLDIVTTENSYDGYNYNYPDRLIWYQRVDDHFEDGETLYVDTYLNFRPYWPIHSFVIAKIVDIDNDGDLDVLTVAESDARLVLHENQLRQPVGAPGDFDRNGQINDADIDQLFAAAASGRTDEEYDLNHDAHVDNGDIAFLLNDILQTTPGDANLDRHFDSADFVLIFQAGLYEQTNRERAGWASGDWNGDGFFNSSDLILAFQEGNYVAADLNAIAYEIDHGMLLDTAARVDTKPRPF